MASHRWFVASVLLATSVLFAVPGCINLGTRHIQDNPATNSRIQALETRVSALERVLSTATGAETLPATAE